MNAKALMILSGSLLWGLLLIGCNAGQSLPPDNPVPSISALSPANATAGGQAFSLAVNGSNFLSTSVVRWNGSDRSTTFVSSTQLTAAISAADIANAGSANVSVFNPAPGGGASNGATFSINNPAPAISGLTPSSATAGGPASTLTVDGSNFVSSSVVQWSGSNRTTTFVSSTRLNAAIPATDIAAAGTANVTVVNPAPGGGISNATPFTVNNPAPAVSGLTPSSATAGGSAFTLAVDGSNFVSSSVVQWNGSNRPTTFVSSSRLTAAIPSSDIATSGTAQVTVLNPTPGGGASNASAFSIGQQQNPTPSVSSVVPASAMAGGGAFTLTVNGSNFLSGSAVRWNGSDRSTTYVSSTQLTAAISAADIANAGSANVSVFNPAPGGGDSNASTFTINNPVPAVSGLSPSSETAGGTAFTLMVSGSNFVSSSVVRWNGSDRSTTYVSSTQLTAAISAADIANAGSANVSVFNPAPGGGASNGASFSINNPAPAVSGLNPSSATAGGSAFTLTVDGLNFVSGSVVQWNGSNRTTTFVSSSRLTAAIPATDIAAAGTANVTVVNPGPGGGPSNAMSFTVTPATPVITSLSPAWTTVGGPGFTLTVNGTNFVAGSVVRWDGSDRSTIYVSSTQLTAAILASDIAFAGTPLVWVVNPGGYPTSNAVTFVVRNSIPVLTSLSPTSAIVGDAPVILTVTGSNFVAGAVVRWNGSDRSTTFVDATRLDAQILATDLAAEGSAQVTVVNPAPGGGTSQAVTFPIAARTSNPQPTIVSASDSKAPAGWPGFALTLTGSGFVAASVAQWNGLNRPTTVLSSTQLRAAIPPEELAAAGTAQVAVFNASPGGGTSNALDFTIYAVAPNAVGVVDLASVGEGFASGDSDSWGSAISADGRYVAFASTAGNLVPGDGNNDTDIFLRDTCLGAAAGCTPSLARLPLSDFGWYVMVGAPSISATGRYVAYIEGTFADNSEVVVADTCIGAPVGCLPSVSGVRPSYDTFYNGWIYNVSLSGNGRYAAYSGWDGWVYGSEIADTCLGAPSGCVPSGTGLLEFMDSPVLSADGRYVVFESGSADLVPNDTNGLVDIFLQDTCSGAPAGCTPSTIRVSVDNGGSEADGASFLPAVSGDGRFVGFTSSATNLVTGDTNGADDVFLRDTCIGAPPGCTPSTIRVSVANDGSQADAPSGSAALSADGRYVAFGSAATNLVTGDTNGTDDIFVRDTCLGVPSGCTSSTVRVSVALDGTEGDNRSDFPRISDDGRYVAFQSSAARLAPGSGSSVVNVFVARTGKP